ncbi:MAG TPA: Smr/MutS family protein [Chitinophagaceae bacterium]|nr:Smr/MutS family protein [Chitinophagaceae bacterium]
MKFQVGDKVLVLHSNEEGEVIEILNNKMVMIDVRGVKFPAYIDQLDFPYFKRFTEKKLFPKKKEKQHIDDVRKEKKPPHKTVDGVWLSFLPVMDIDEFGDDVVETLKIHLINHTKTAYHFIYHQQFFGKTEFDLKNEIKPFEDFYLHDVSFADMSDSPSFNFEFSLMQQEKRKAAFYEASVKLKPKQLFARIEEIKQKGQATFSYRLFEHYPDKSEEEKMELDSFAAKGIKIYNAKEARKHLPPARTVVDLHVEKLTNDWKRLSNAEILSIQFKEFEKWYELATAHFQSQLIIIHGVGSGKLRDEIHDILRLKREVKSFVNQYHPSFGYGATEIFFQY